MTHAHSPAHTCTHNLCSFKFTLLNQVLLAHWQRTLNQYVCDDSVSQQQIITDAACLRFCCALNNSPFTQNMTNYGLYLPNEL